MPRTPAPAPLTHLTRWLIALTCVALGACTALSSSDEFHPSEEDTANTTTAADSGSDGDVVDDALATQCAALCQGLNTCNDETFVVDDCVSACTTKPDGTFGCFMEAITFDTDGSLEPADIKASAGDLCGLLNLRVEPDACDAAVTECDEYCDKVNVFCDGVISTIYTTCFDACLGSYDTDDAAMSTDIEDCANFQMARITLEGLVDGPLYDACLAAASTCAEGSTCTPFGNANASSYWCAAPCSDTQPACENGQECQGGVCLPCQNGNCGGPVGGQCGQISCNPGTELCVLDNCYPTVTCGAATCGAGESCAGSDCACGATTATGQPACRPGEVCAGGQCLAYRTDLCGDKACNPGEVCVDSVCRCGIFNACGEGEYCANERCGCGSSLNTITGTEACPTTGQICAHDRCAAPQPSP